MIKCIICLDDIYNNNITLKCNHDFHLDCLNQWINYNNKKYYKCPVCNKKYLKNYNIIDYYDNLYDESIYHIFNIIYSFFYKN